MTNSSVMCVYPHRNTPQCEIKWRTFQYDVVLKIPDTVECSTYITMWRKIKPHFIIQLRATFTGDKHHI